MALNKNLLLESKLKLRTAELAKIDNKLDDMETRAKKLVALAERSETTEDIKRAEEDLTGLENEIKELETQKSEIETKINELEKEKEELSNKKPDGEMRKNTQKLEVRSSLNKFIHTRGQERAGLTVKGNEVLVPDELLKPQKEKYEANPVLKLIHRIPVKSSGGKYPVFSRSKAKMHSVEELEANPELANPKPKMVKYDIKTYRGKITLSEELIDDAEYDVVDIVQEDIEAQEENTTLFAFGEVLKTARNVDAQGFDGLKDILNKEVKKIYKKALVVTSSMFAAMDKTKNKNGDYMLQKDPSSATGYKFGGYDVYTLDDELLGEANEMKYFIGDVYEFVAFFDRKKATLNWQNHDIYGKSLGTAVRFDMKKADENAGVFGTYTESV